jgi:hypothetical protein
MEYRLVECAFEMDEKQKEREEWKKNAGSRMCAVP